MYLRNERCLRSDTRLLFCLLGLILKHDTVKADNESSVYNTNVLNDEHILRQGTISEYVQRVLFFIFKLLTFLVNHPRTSLRYPLSWQY